MNAARRIDAATMPDAASGLRRAKRRTLRKSDGGLKVLALDVGERLEKNRAQLEVDRHVLVLREVGEALRRRKIDLLHHVVVGEAFQENRVQPLFDKRQEANAVFRERLGKALRRELVFHAAYFTTFRWCLPVDFSSDVANMKYVGANIAMKNRK